MTLFEWVALFGAITGGTTVVLAISKYFRERRQDPRVAVGFESANLPDGKLVVSITFSDAPISGLQIQLFNESTAATKMIHIGRPGTAEHTIPITVNSTRDVWAFMSYVHPANPRKRFLQWAPVSNDGPPDLSLLSQTARRPLVSWYLRYIQQAPVGPRGIPARAAGRKERRELRKAIKALQVKKWPSTQPKPQTWLLPERPSAD